MMFYLKENKDVSREFDEFQVNTRLCTLLVLVLYYMGEFSLGAGSYFLSTIFNIIRV